MEEEIKKEILGKAGFPIYVDYWDKYFSLMSGDQIKEVLEIVFHFNRTYEVLSSNDLSITMVVNTIIDNLKRDARKGIKQSKASRDNGLLGGRPKKDGKPKTSNKNKDISKKPILKIEIPDFIDAGIWNNFVNHRIKKKAPLNENSIAINLKKLEKWENEVVGSANQALEDCIANNYQGIFQPKINNQTNKFNNSRIKF